MPRATAAERSVPKRRYPAWKELIVHVLVVEDDPRIARLVARTLTEAHHRVTSAADGLQGLQLALSSGYDLVVLDVMLPGLDGLVVCRRLRQHQRMPVLMLTARDAVTDRVRGLDAGADDFLIKPFALDELLARVRALHRRSTGGPDDDLLRVADLTIDRRRHEGNRAERAIAFTAKEFALLEYLMRHTGQVLTRDQLIEHVWGYDADHRSNVVEIYIHYLRDKVDRDGARPLIRTVRGVGYTIKA